MTSASKAPGVETDQKVQQRGCKGRGRKTNKRGVRKKKRGEITHNACALYGKQGRTGRSK